MGAVGPSDHPIADGWLYPGWLSDERAEDPGIPDFYHADPGPEEDPDYMDAFERLGESRRDLDMPTVKPPPRIDPRFDYR